MLLSWEERAARVSAGEFDLATAPTGIDDTTYRAMFEAMFRHTADSIVLCNTNTGVYYEVSDLFCELTGYAREELIGQSSLTLGLVSPDGVRRHVELDGVSGRHGFYENQLTRKDGTHRWVQFSHQDIGAEYTLVIARDVTKTRELEDSLRDLASTDPLTHVLNRRSFHEKADALLALCPSAVLIVADIDKLKTINDTWGHAVGDDAIIAIASALTTSAGPDSIVGRLGGDEFAVLVTGAPKDVSDTVRSVRSALGAVPFHPQEKAVSASIGVAYGFEAYDALERAADEAMYAGKRMRAEAQ